MAVKVQRPGVRQSIALDIHVLRGLAGAFGRWRRLNSDLPGLLDEVGPALGSWGWQLTLCAPMSTGWRWVCCDGLSGVLASVAAPQGIPGKRAMPVVAFGSMARA